MVALFSAERAAEHASNHRCVCGHVHWIDGPCIVRTLSPFNASWIVCRCAGHHAAAVNTNQKEN